MSKDIHGFAAFVHGALCFGHALGIVYNLKRRNRLDVIVHALALGYSLHSTRHHVRLT